MRHLYVAIFSCTHALIGLFASLAYTMEPLNQEQLSIVGYWQGYQLENKTQKYINPYPLNQVPDNVKYINIAFVVPLPSSDKSPSTTWEFDKFFVYEKEQIINWIIDINERNNGQKVLFSLRDTDAIPWTNVDIKAFAKNIVQAVEDFNLAGLDINVESGISSEDFVACFTKLIDELNLELPHDKIITLTMFTQNDLETSILENTKGKIVRINTMDYWLTADMVQEHLDFYGQYAGKDNVSIGVGAGIFTPLSTLEEIANYLRNKNNNKMMLWALTSDVQALTGFADRSWLNTIVTSLTPSVPPFTHADYIKRPFPQGYIDGHQKRDHQKSNDQNKYHQNHQKNNLIRSIIGMFVDHTGF